MWRVRTIISVLTQWGAALVIQLKERERKEKEKAMGARPSLSPVACFRSGLLAVLTYGSRYVATTLYVTKRADQRYTVT